MVKQTKGEKSIIKQGRVKYNVMMLDKYVWDEEQTFIRNVPKRNMRMIFLITN